MSYALFATTGIGLSLLSSHTICVQRTRLEMRVRACWENRQHTARALLPRAKSLHRAHSDAGVGRQ